jgi:hypothetical protein
MFVQVIQGTVTDAGQVHRALERWQAELMPGAVGWLGSTAGVTADGRFVALARFDSEESARRNSDRPEQDAWWADTAKLFDGEVTFRDSNDVTLDLHGDPDRAGFVQVMQGHGSDPDRARELMSQNTDKWAEFRPDVLGSVAVTHEGGAWTMAMYFTSEAEAREGERKDPPPELQAEMEEIGKLMIGEPEYLDLPDPWVYSPR